MISYPFGRLYDFGLRGVSAEKEEYRAFNDGHWSLLPMMVMRRFSWSGARGCRLLLIS